jgi:hypothetical protein
MPAFAGVCRAPCADQGRHSGWPLRQWRNPANAAGDACGAVFDLARVILTGEQRAVRIAPPRRQAFAARVPACSISGTRTHIGRGRSGARRDAGRPRLTRARDTRVRSKNRLQASPSAEVPLSSQASRMTSLSNRSLTGSRITQTEAAIVRHAPEGGFSGRSPRRRDPDLPRPTGSGAHSANLRLGL